VLSSLASAADSFYLGAWKITSALVAPWAGPGRKPDDAASKTLAGKRVVIKPAEIAGPQAVACKSPRYRLRHYGADILFQGMLDEMRPCDSSVEPLKLARTLGFAASPGRPWRRAAATKSNCISWTRPLPNSVFTTLSTF
jgi:hypothetical protein